VTVGAAAITVIGGFLLAIALASADAYRGTADRIPTIQYGILVPILIGGLLIWRSPRVARIIDAVPQHWLVGVQLMCVWCWPDRARAHCEAIRRLNGLLVTPRSALPVPGHHHLNAEVPHGALELGVTQQELHCT
jgi:hypothetical protein